MAAQPHHDKIQPMLKTRRGFNPKRKIIESIDEGRMDVLASRVAYGGNPEHKRNPGDFGLTPPATPRAHMTLCDEVGIVKSDPFREKVRQIWQKAQS